ncbi:hypothetical protein NIES2119_17300 [[Phormidium ambiguum] IAM M-71]|uniref:Uncharacterized protein n=1 Tax=[Phormidium ambiguum] IAM M-71 TaxID=454136 RepID=A0A1U7IH67_9CYAN|nr:hypothetical protein [Phormidium ambiguum]OKH36398.1 hypothetical protein NIES2119_17300 [Phormidium ambiguum IAM M-71]
MNKVTKSWRLICQILSTGLLITNIWLFNLPSAIAATNTPHEDTHLTQGDSNISKHRIKRIDTIAECRKYLEQGNNNKTAQLDRPLDKMGNDRLVGALKASDNPNPTEAEVAFKRCLEANQIVPTPTESDRS